MCVSENVEKYNFLSRLNTFIVCGRNSGKGLRFCHVAIVAEQARGGCATIRFFRLLQDARPWTLSVTFFPIRVNITRKFL
ncbi:hypothetical protein [Chromobacterium sp. ASV23]|uniref:hypothetical protein n=1 Tax=Chromobacterium sp. ASV23 TaxID=2795110 RepID=UPI0018EC3229|nr:hypothetical protein [Chromobacterium sp. ASV23]